MKKSKSNFGIDNCKKPRSNKKMYKTNSSTRKINTINNQMTIIEL